MMEGGISKRLINLCQALMGAVVGSMGVITVFAPA